MENNQNESKNDSSLLAHNTFNERNKYVMQSVMFD